jgi:hypothetical protein
MVVLLQVVGLSEGKMKADSWLIGEYGVSGGRKNLQKNLF